MIINVASLRGTFVSHTNTAEIESAWGTVLYVPMHRWIQPAHVDTLLRSIASDFRASAELVVLRAHEPDAAALLDDENLRIDLTNRLAGRPVYVLRWRGGAYALEHLAGDVPAEPPNLADFASALRAAEFEALAVQPGVELPTSQELHYVGPNGNHYSSFLRIGTAIQSVDALDGVAFWLIGHLSRRTLIMLDSWTVLSVGLNIARYVRESGIEDREVVGVECQREYDEATAEIGLRLDAALEHHRLDGAVQVLVVVSLSSTGDSVVKLRDLCQGRATTGTVALFAGPSHEGTTFCRREEDERWPPDDCQRCREDVAKVTISPATYLLELTAAHSCVSLTQDVVNPLADIFTRYRGKSVFRVHAQQDDGDKRHHMVDVDVPAMLSVPAFHERLKATLERHPAFDIIVVPPHPKARELADLVSELSGREVIPCFPADLLRLESHDHERLRGRRVLLVDDVMITGTRLHSYRHFMQRADFVDDDFQLQYLVAIARPPSNELLRGVGNSVHGSRYFSAVETLLLPNWGERECPWCHELALMRGAHESGPASAFVADRVARLSSPEGLSDDIFLPWNPDDPGYWDLGAQSLFKVDTQAELFVAVAAALQDLRARSAGLNERLTFPVARVLEPTFYMGQRYYAACVTAAVLRAARAHDTYTSAIDDQLRTTTTDLLLGSDAFAGMRSETLFAMARRRLPLIASVGDDGDVLSSFPDPAIAFALSGALGLRG